VKDSIEGLNIVDLTKEVIEPAINEVKIKDFEDALQYHSARRTMKVFVTRNKRHFEKVKDGIEVLTPEEFINRYGSLVY
jgi:predicted nucleic acid-binding protein